MLRLFVAIELPEDLRLRLSSLAGGVPNANWVPEENIHLTLRFIGEVDEAVAEDIDEALSQIEAPAFELTLSGVGQFGGGRGSRVLWAGVERNDRLLHLNGKIESALVRIGLEREERKYSPHITLARLKKAPTDRIGRFLAENGLFRAGPVPVRSFALIVSHMTRHGSIYEPASHYPLIEDGAA